MESFKAAIVGRWILCGNESPFGKDRGDVGLEILADGRWFKLYTALGGGTVRGAGFDEEGTWDAIGSAPNFQLNLNIFGGGGLITNPTLASSPRALRINNFGVFVGNYVFDPTVPLGNIRCKAHPPDAGGSLDANASCSGRPQSSQCATNPTGEVAPPTLESFEAAIVGRWILCGNESPFGKDKGDVGLEILADGRWFKLFPAPGGATVRGAGFDEEGTWDALGSAPFFQINLNIFGSGTVISTPALASSPRALRINNNGVFIGSYVDDPTVPGGTARCR